MSKKAAVLKPVDSPASTLSATERMTYLLDAMLNDYQCGVPTLVGPTQSGKTHFLSRYLEAKGYRVIIVNPQNDLPEDIAGWPYREGGVLSFTQPSLIPSELLAPKHPLWALLVDEVDKARDDTLSSLLTLLNSAERRLRHTRIPDDVPILCAMNERQTLPQPLIERLLFMAWPPDGYDAIAVRPELQPLAWLVKEICSPPVVAFPQRVDTLGSMHKLARWVQQETFWRDQAVRYTVVRGLFSEKATAVIMARLGEERPKQGVLWAKTVTAPQLLEHIIEVLSAANYEEGCEILKTLAEQANEDKTGEFERALVLFLNCQPAIYAVHRPDKLIEGKAALAEAIAAAKPK
mgnify:FL=1